MHSVALALVDRGNQMLRYVGKGNMVAAFLQQGPNKAPADVARADHNCLFHVCSRSFSLFFVFFGPVGHSIACPSRARKIGKHQKIPLKSVQNRSNERF